MANYEDKDGKLTITLTEEESNEIRSKRLGWRITDLLFFGSMIIYLLTALIIIWSGGNIPNWFEYTWLGFLMCIVIPKVFLPKTKFVRWLEKYRW